MPDYDFESRLMEKQIELDKESKDIASAEPEKEITPEEYINSKEKSGSNSNDKTEESNRLAEETAKRNAEEAAEKDDETEVGITYEKPFRREVDHQDTKAQTARRPGRKSNSDAKSCQIRDFPLSLVKMCKLSLGEGDAEVLPNTKALAAFVYANKDPDLDIDYSDVPEDIIALSKHFDKTKAVNNISNDMKDIQRQLRELRIASFQNSAQLSYIICDKLTHINNPAAPDAPGSVNFALKEVAELLDKLDDDTPKLRQMYNDLDERGQAIVRPKRGENK